MEFYRKRLAEIYSELGTSENGLTDKQAEENIKRYGLNKLEDKDKKSVFRVFAEQFKDFLVIILIISAIISGILGDIESAIVILVVITINAILGTVQHTKATQSLEGLKSMSAPSAKVIRNGELQVIEGKDVAVGDIVVMEAGDYVCADGRIIENALLKIDESALTGESEPVEKDNIEINEEKPLGDRVNMLYSGSFVTYGRGKFVVTSTGMNTEIGKIATLLKNTKEKKTPLQTSLDEFGKKLSFIIIGICIIVFALSAFRGEKLVDAFVFAVALAVAAIPEALSSIVTIVLSAGTQRLAEEHAIIRKLHAVEGLGCVSVICSDKTGTLTQNKMTVKKIYFDGEVIDADKKLTEKQIEMVFDSVLCSDATNKDGQATGDPTEIALIDFANDNSLSPDEIRGKNVRIGEIPFDSDRKLMSVVYERNGKNKMITKGAVDVLIPLIKSIETADGIREFTADDKEKLRSVNLKLSQNGLRVLALAVKTVDSPQITTDDENGYTLSGLFAMQDPLRVESAQAVANCKSAGIMPIMITGDHLITASAIAREAGILEDGKRAVEGAEIEKLTDSELEAFVEDVAVYARVSPEHKIRIVEAWQRKGYIVSMTGDGVNDAPALKQADIGVAMGITGSEVAKDSASVVLTDDNFATIVKAVENGRNIYRNIQRSVQFLLSGNAAGIIAVLYASLLALPVPFQAVHLLFINLLTDSLPAIALGVEPHSSDVMHHKPRDKKQSILTKRLMRNVIVEGIVIAAATLTAFYIGLQRSEAAAGTMAFATLCLSRLTHGFNCKSDRPICFTRKMWQNKSMIGAFLVGIVLLTAVLFVPWLHGIFKVEILTVNEYLAVYLLPLVSFAIIQIIKIFTKEK